MERGVSFVRRRWREGKRAGSEFNVVKVERSVDVRFSLVREGKLKFTLLKLSIGFERRESSSREGSWDNASRFWIEDISLENRSKRRKFGALNS